MGTMVKTTKKLSAKRQILAAIEHFDKKDYECAITLAGAGENQIKEDSKLHLFQLIRAKFSSDETNLFYNWMKHSSGPDGAEIDELEVVTSLIRAVQKYVDAYKETCPQFEEFSKWCVAKGYTKKPLTEKAKA
jgi:hypothetical protein